MKKKKLDLKGLETLLPPIESNETKIILGGNGYGDNTSDIDFILGDASSTFILYTDFNGADDGSNQQDVGDVIDQYDQNYDDYGQDQDGDVPSDGGIGYVNYAMDNLNQIFSDGANINNGHFAFNINNSFQNFGEELKTMVSSNSVVSNILSYVNNGYISLSFKTANLPGNVFAYTDPLGNGQYQIVFNSDYIDANGATSYPYLDDSIGFDLTQLENGMEYLLVTLTHEALHVKHDAIFRDFLADNNYNNSDTVAALLAAGYSQQFVNCFFQQDSWGNWQITSGEQAEALLHQYMSDHDIPVIQAALNEFRADVGELNQTISDIQQLMDEAVQNFNNTEEDGHGDGDWWRNLYDQLDGNLRDIHEQWGHLLD